MALYKRGTTWWTDFTVNGQRFRQSLDTTDWRQAQSTEKELITQASQGKLAGNSQHFSRLGLSEALDRYLADRKVRVVPRSHRSESDHAKPLRENFAATPVKRITAESVLAYIRQRKSDGVSNTTINMEIGILRRVLKRAKRWHFIADDVSRLPERRDVGRALSKEQKARLLRIAATRPEWETALLAALLALNTTMRAAEIRGLKWGDINLMDRLLTIRRSKTRAGERVIPLNAEAMAAVLRLRERSKSLFGDDLSADWYVFPHAEGYSKPDATKAMSTWRSAWRNLTRAVECPSCGLLQAPTKECRGPKCKTDMKDVRSPLHGLRFHDLRHHAITELAESVASDQTIMSIAGHVSPRMLAHYSHVRIEAKRQALDALARKQPARDAAQQESGYVTKYVTNSDEGPAEELQTTEKYGGDDETRTRDLCRDSDQFNGNPLKTGDTGGAESQFWNVRKQLLDHKWTMTWARGTGSGQMWRSPLVLAADFLSARRASRESWPPMFPA